MHNGGATDACMMYLRVAQICQDPTAGCHSTGLKRVPFGLHTMLCHMVACTARHNMTTQGKVNLESVLSLVVCAQNRLRDIHDNRQMYRISYLYASNGDQIDSRHGLALHCDMHSKLRFAVSCVVHWFSAIVQWALRNDAV